MAPSSPARRTSRPASASCLGSRISGLRSPPPKPRPCRCRSPAWSGTISSKAWRKATAMPIGRPWRASPQETPASERRGGPSVSLMAVAKFERFFRRAASLDVDKSDLKRYSDFINRKIYDLLLRAQAAARANARSIIEPFDLPITKGLQESIQDFRKLD